jgi:ppGpp synthetase/RelA/SpoT-type nucleotidyltranferase
MNFQEYKISMKDVYKNFSTLIKQILEKALTDNDFRYQQIQSREKSSSTLHRKLESEELLESNEIESKIKDLAAWRIIFYFDNYIQSLLNSDVIKNEFDIEPDSYKLFNVAAGYGT